MDQQSQQPTEPTPGDEAQIQPADAPSPAVQELSEQAEPSAVPVAAAPAPTQPGYPTQQPQQQTDEAAVMPVAASTPVAQPGYPYPGGAPTVAPIAAPVPVAQPGYPNPNGTPVVVPAAAQAPVAQPGYPTQQQFGYPAPQDQGQQVVQPQQGYVQPQPMGAPPAAVVVQQPPDPSTTKMACIPASINLPEICQRSLITGICLLVVGFAYFILGCASSAVPSWAAEGTIVGLFNMASGIAGILMKFKLPKVDTCENLLMFSWVFIVCGAISLATGLGALRFVILRVVYGSSNYSYIARNFGLATANFFLGTAAAAITFVLLIIVLSVVMLSCSGSIRRRMRVAMVMESSRAPK